MQNKFLIIQTCVPVYRTKLFNELLKSNALKIISGKNYYDSGIKSVESIDGITWVKNFYFFNYKILFQLLPWEKVFSSKSIIIEFNLRNISFHLVVLIRILIGKPIYLWGHLWSRSGPKSKSEIIRFFYKKYTSGYITYTETQKKELEKKLPNKKIYSANNSIYFSSELYPKIIDQSSIQNFIYVGRLVKSKKPMLLVMAFQEFLKTNKSSKLFVIGDGLEKDKILDYIKKNNLQNKIYLPGHISDYNTLRNYYSKSIASVSPGYVGLSITQSLGFGVPIIISKNEPHSPEIEAARIGYNSELFQTDSIDDLALKLNTFYKNKENWIAKRNEISEFCRQNYSIEKMAEPFIKIFNEK